MYLNSKKIKASPVSKAHCLHSYSLEVTAVRQEKEIKGIQIGREEVKQSLFAGDKLLNIEDFKKSKN